MESLSALISQAQRYSVHPLQHHEHGHHLHHHHHKHIERSVLDACRHPVILAPSDEPCSHFFQQQGTIDFKSYLRLKREEQLAVIRFHAAKKIQAAWRGFLIRSNMKIVEAAIIKIQSWIRGFLARRRYKEKLAASEAQQRRDMMNKAATKIQAWWRGILSRKNKFDFKRYKEIKEKNEALRRSIERINELEQALLKSLDPRESCESSDCISLARGSFQSQFEDSSISQECEPYVSPMISLSNLSPSLEQFIVNKLPEVVDEMSETRISELYAYMASLETEMNTEKELERRVRKAGGIQNLNPSDAARLEESRRNQKDRANVILGIAKLGLMANRGLKKEILLRGKDSVDDLFPQMPDRDDVIHPDMRKVEALKDAIRMFRIQSRDLQQRELQKMHVYLRTKQRPGVFSDIYTTELTEVERKLKSVKYWRTNVIAERRAKREHEAQNKRLKRLFAHAIRITNTNNITSEEEGEVDDGTSHQEDDGTLADEYEEYCGEMGPESDTSESERSAASGNDGNRKKHCYYNILPLDPHPPPPTPIFDDQLAETDTSVVDLD